MIQERLNDLATLGVDGMAKKRGPRLLGPSAAPAMVQEVVDIQTASIRPEGYQRATGMLADSDMFSDVRRFPAGLPVQIIYGEDDAITPPDLCRAVAEACKAAAHPVLNAGHALYLETLPK